MAWHFFQFSMVLHVMTSMFERWVIPTYKNYGLEPFNLQKFILRYFNTVLPGSIIFLCGFYGLLHTWMNACAELLRFGDRLFYKVIILSKNFFYLHFFNFNLIFSLK